MHLLTMVVKTWNEFSAKWTNELFLVLVFWLLFLTVNFCVDTKNKNICNVPWPLDSGNTLSKLRVIAVFKHIFMQLESINDV